MNRPPLLIGLVFLLALTASPALAQKPSAPTRPTASPSGSPPAAPIPATALAVIYTEAFTDPKNGIARFNTALTRLNGEFAVRQKELDDMKLRIDQLQNEIAKGQSTPAKVDQLNQLKKDYQRKGEDATADYAKRRDDILIPLNQEVGKALEGYAKAHGITVIVDGSRVALAYAADGTDITSAFIKDFNSKNP